MGADQRPARRPRFLAASAADPDAAELLTSCTSRWAFRPSTEGWARPETSGVPSGQQQGAGMGRITRPILHHCWGGALDKLLRCEIIQQRRGPSASDTRAHPGGTRLPHQAYAELNCEPGGLVELSPSFLPSGGERLCITTHYRFPPLTSRRFSTLNDPRHSNTLDGPGASRGVRHIPQDGRRRTAGTELAGISGNTVLFTTYLPNSLHIGAQHVGITTSDQPWDPRMALPPPGGIASRTYQAARSRLAAAGTTRRH